MKKLIAQGAEAKIYLNKNIVIKDRIPKTYRLPQLDIQIRTRRTKSEAKLLTKAAEHINVPEVLDQDKFNIQIQHIPGDRLSETLSTYPEKKQFSIMQQLGEQTAKLHENNIIHGDLTTSNTILATSSPKPTQDYKRAKRDNNITDAKHQQISSKNKLFIIDFGLGFISSRIEDKAVDLHLIKQALEAKHFQNHEKLFQHFLKTYTWEETSKVLKQLEKVESRGRYKH